MNYVRLKRGYMLINNRLIIITHNHPRIIPLLSTKNTAWNAYKNIISMAYLRVIRTLCAYNNSNNSLN